MITEAQQYQIHQGDEDVFGEVFRANNMRVYYRALAVLEDRLAAKAVVIETFTAFRAALRNAPGPMDADALLYQLTDEAIERVDALRKRSPESVQADAQTVAPLALNEDFELTEDDDHYDARVDEVRYDGRNYKRKSSGWLGSVLLALLFAAAFFWMLSGALMRGGAVTYRDWGFDRFIAFLSEWLYIRI